MIRTPIFLAGVCVILVGLPNQRIHAEDPPTAPIEDAFDLSRHYRAALGRESIEKLKLSVDAGLSIQAAWWEVLGTSREEAVRIPKDDRAIRASRFVGFVEGRLRVPVPEWWRRTVTEFQVREGAGASFLTQAEWRDLRPDTKLPFAISDGFEVEVAKAQTVFRQGKLAETFSEVELAKLVGGGLYVSAACDERVVAIAASSGFPMPINISVVDRKTHTRLWDGRCWSWVLPKEPHLASTHTDSYFQVYLAKDSVTVFGAGGWSIFIGSFALSDGKPIARFCSNF